MYLLTENLKLLEQMGHSRNIARDRVKNILDHLHRLSKDLSNLRDQVAQPVLIAGNDAVPLETHLESLRQGIPELKAIRLQSIQRCAISHDRRLRIIMIKFTSRRESYAQGE